MKYANKLLGKSVLIGVAYLALVFLAIFLFSYYPFDDNLLFQKKISVLELPVQWDAVHYENLINKGYSPGALFPLYPLVARMVSFFTPSYLLAGYLASWLALILAIYYFYKLLKLDYSQELSDKIIMLMLVFPASFFFALLYTESLFIFLSVAAIYYLRQNKYFLSAILIAGAVVTRSVGVFLLPLFIYQLLAAKASRKNLFYLLLPAASLAGFMIFCQMEAGNALYFIKAQAGWDKFRHLGWPWQSAKILWLYIKDSVYNIYNVGFKEIGSYLMLVAATVYFLINKRWLYGFYCLMPAVLFGMYAPFYSVNRFIAVIFPIYIMLGELTDKRKWVYNFLLALFGLILIFNIVQFTKGAWIG